MDKIITFYNQYKDQIHMAAVGAILVITAYIAIELSLVLIGLFFTNAAQHSKKEQEEHRERIKTVVKEQQKAQAELESIRQSQEKAVSEVEAKANKDVDDFIDGEWK